MIWSGDTICSALGNVKEAVTIERFFESMNLPEHVKFRTYTLLRVLNLGNRKTIKFSVYVGIRSLLATSKFLTKIPFRFFVFSCNQNISYMPLILHFTFYILHYILYIYIF